MYTQNLILNWTTRMNFPLKVRSTALQINSRLSDYFKNSPYVATLSPFKACCFKSQACIFFACKFEDIHGYLDRIAHKIGDFSGLHYLKQVLEIEVEVFRLLEFDFNYVNLYQSMLAVKFLIEKDKPDESIQWEYLAVRLNKVLCVADLRGNLMEAVLAVFDKEAIEGVELKYNKDIVDQIREKSETVDFILDQEIQDRCLCLEDI